VNDITREEVRINLFSIIYLVMWIERSHDYHFTTQAGTLAVLSALGSRNPYTWG
jgi:hypothetical protein